nr:hypothetical protein [Pseudoalteromonas rubra]
MAHIIIGMGILESFNMLGNQSIELALLSSLIFCLSAWCFAMLWSRKFTQGRWNGYSDTSLIGLKPIQAILFMPENNTVDNFSERLRNTIQLCLRLFLNMCKPLINKLSFIS